MSVHLHLAIDNLKKRLLSLSAMVEDAIAKSLTALLARDATLAQKIIEEDKRIDQVEVEVEEECLKVLALHQPVASDLRFVIACLKMNNSLERMGDLAANVAKRVLVLGAHAQQELPPQLSEMGRIARQMVKDSLDSLVNQDPSLAREVCAVDDQLDDMRERLQEEVFDRMRTQPEKLEINFALLSVIRHLERIGDMATHVAEDVVYMVNGEIVRHGNNP